MEFYRPLRVILFIYDILRLAALAAVFAFFSPLEGAALGKVFPCLAFMTPGALFPLMSLFILVKPGDYKNYLPLYLAGKIIGAAAFFFWAFYSLKDTLALPYFGLDPGSLEKGFYTLNGSFFLVTGDLVTIILGLALENKIKTVENGGR